MAWVLRRRGALLEAKQWCEMVLNQWSELIAAIPFRWLAYAPLLAIALDLGHLEQAVGYARQMLDESQQQLSHDLPDLLTKAVQAWEENKPEAAHELLHRFCHRATQLGYI